MGNNPDILQPPCEKMLRKRPLRFQKYHIQSSLSFTPKKAQSPTPSLIIHYVWDLGFGAWGLGFRAWGLGFKDTRTSSANDPAGNSRNALGLQLLGDGMLT